MDGKVSLYVRGLNMTDLNKKNWNDLIYENIFNL